MNSLHVMVQSSAAYRWYFKPNRDGGIEISVELRFQKKREYLRSDNTAAAVDRWSTISEPPREHQI